MDAAEQAALLIAEQNRTIAQMLEVINLQTEVISGLRTRVNELCKRVDHIHAMVELGV